MEKKQKIWFVLEEESMPKEETKRDIAMQEMELKAKKNPGKKYVLVEAVQAACLPVTPLITVYGDNKAKEEE